MKCSPWFGVWLALAALPVMSSAQEAKKSEAAFVKDHPTVGDTLPDVVVYDPQGNEVKTSELRGHHTVLTFGCLT